MDNPVVRGAVRSGNVAIAIVVGLMCCAAGAVALFVTVVQRFSWFMLGAAVLLLVHGLAAWVSAYRRSASRRNMPVRSRLMSPGQWQLVAAGYFLSAAIFIVAAVVGDERQVAGIGSVVGIVGGAVRLAVGRRLASDELAA